MLTEFVQYFPDISDMCLFTEGDLGVNAKLSWITQGLN